MEKLFERFSLGHVLSVIAPGLIALIVVFFRCKWDLTNILGPHLSSSPTVAGSFVVILAYGLGLLLLECVNAGAKLYVNLRLRRMVNIGFARPATALMLLHRLLGSMIFGLAILFFWIPLPRMRDSFVEAQMMMSEFNESVSHTFELGRISSPFETLDLFRKLLPRIKLSNTDIVLEHASEVHNRLLFALSISLVITCIGLGVSCDFALEWSKAVHLSSSLLVVLVAGLGSFCLRIIAARCWEVELILVSSLAEWRSK